MQDFRHLSMKFFFSIYICRELASTWVQVDFGCDCMLLSPESNYPHFVYAIALSFNPLQSQEAEKHPSAMGCYPYHLRLRGLVRCLDTVQMNMGRLLYFQVSRRPGFGSTTNLCYVGWLLGYWGYFPKTTVFAVLDPRPGAPAALPAWTRRCFMSWVFFTIPVPCFSHFHSRFGFLLPGGEFMISCFSTLCEKESKLFLGANIGPWRQGFEVLIGCMCGRILLLSVLIYLLVVHLGFF